MARRPVRPKSSHGLIAVGHLRLVRLIELKYKTPQNMKKIMILINWTAAPAVVPLFLAQSCIANISIAVTWKTLGKYLRGEI
jgi:hypothetical protein